jgi:hypothetical protein
MIVIDAMPHRYVGPELTPNLWIQATHGARAVDGGVSLPMSVTYANHAAFVTGVDPAVTGVYGNHTWIDGDGWVKSPKAGPRAETLFDRVADAGGRSVIIAGDHKLIGQMGGNRADVSWPPNGRLPEGTSRCEFGYPLDSEVVSVAAATDLDADFVVLHLNQPDTTSHVNGPDSAAALAQYTATDAAYGELIAMLADGWDHTIVITLSDHDQETITDQSPIPLVDALALFEDLDAVGDGTGALIHGPVDDAAITALLALPGVEGVEQLSDDVWMAWTEPGRMFDAASIPLRGQHGSPRCRTQLAIVSGGDARRESLERWVSGSRPSALDWAPMIAQLLGVDGGGTGRDQGVDVGLGGRLSAALGVGAGGDRGVGLGAGIDAGARTAAGVPTNIKLLPETKSTAVRAEPEPTAVVDVAIEDVVLADSELVGSENAEDDDAWKSVGGGDVAQADGVVVVGAAVSRAGVALRTEVDPGFRDQRAAVSVDVAFFREHGWIVMTGAIPPAELAVIDAGVGDVARWSESDGPGLHHFEQTDRGAMLARSEYFVTHHDALRRFITQGLISNVLESLFGEPAVLFKEKINYKHPGGGGFAPHQDATAYRFVDHHISCMVPLDPATPESGCLYVAGGYANGSLPTDARGRIEEETAALLDWQPVLLEPGDLLFFDSYTPHYSDTNTTDRPRRAAYLTYNAASKGHFRERYYADKRAEFATAGGDFDGERVRISISDDFLGRPARRDV